MALGDVHEMRGCHCSYVLKCEGGDEGYHVYVGSTSDIEQRMAKHGSPGSRRHTKVAADGRTLAYQRT